MSERKPPAFKENFKQKYAQILGDELEEFLSCSITPLNPVMRVNTLKITKKEMIERIKKKGWEYRLESFYDNAITITKKDQPIGNTKEHFLGYYYVQEKASMLPPLAMDLKLGQTVLDVAASPGSKTSQISQELNNTGIILANDINLGRVSILKSNLQRMGCMNTLISLYNGVFLNNLNTEFDRILVDAPCTATGTIRRNWHVINQYNPNSAMELSKLQKPLLNTAYKLLKENGVLVYSTCSLEVEENELVINQFLQKNPEAKIEKVKYKGLKTRPGITNWEKYDIDSRIKNATRIYPQDNDSEGFFVTRIRK